MNVSRLSLLAVALMSAGMAHATNGYFLPGFGIKATGMGGVGIAAPQDAISAAANPANLAKVGMRGDMGITVFNPVRSAATGTASETGDSSFFGFNGKSDSDLEWFYIPEMAVAMPLTERLNVGLAFVGNGGMNTTYELNFFDSNQSQGLSKLGVDLNQLLIPLSASFRVNEDHVVGASLVGAVQRFRAYGINNFQAISSNPNFVTNNGFDYSYGAGVKFGWLGDFMDDRLLLGATWASKVYMTKFDKYKGLFAEQGDFDIPETYGLGLSFKANDKLTLAADVTRIIYEGVAAVSNRGPGIDTGPGFQGVQSGFPCGVLGNAVFCLGEDQGMGFGWRDMTIYKVGADWQMNENLTLRAGFNYGKSPIPDDQVTFNTLAPAVVEKHYSVGFTWKSSESPLEISGAYMYVAENSQHAVDQNIVGGVDIEMHQHVLGVSVGWVLDAGPGLH